MQKKFREDLSVMRNSNEYIHSIYFYDSNKSLIITDREIEYSFSDFTDKEWYKEALETTVFPAVLNTVGYDDNTVIRIILFNCSKNIQV